MKKTMVAAAAAMLLFNTILSAQELIQVGTDGFSIIYMPGNFENDPTKVSNDAGCYIGSVFLPGQGGGTNDLEREANKMMAINKALLQQQNEATQKAVCPIVTLNGVTIQVNNTKRYELFPLAFSGWAFDFSKSSNTDFLKRIEKVSHAAKIDKNVLFLKWAIDRSTVSVSTDSTGEFIVDEKQLDIGADAITRAYWLQKLAIDADPLFEDIKKAFERDVMKGWTPDQKTKSLAKRLSSQASWFECRQVGQKVKAVADVSTEQIIKHVRSQSVKSKQRLYLSLRIHEGKNKPITRGDRIGGLPIDERYFNDPIKDKYDYTTGEWITLERSLAWNYYTTVPNDPTLLWIADRTFADDPVRCEQLVPVEKAAYLADPNKISKEDAPAGEWVSNPGNGCSSVMEIGRVDHFENQQFGHKRMSVVRGENVAQKGIIVYGDGLTPKVFYTKDLQACQKLKNDGGLKIGKWFFPNRTAESEKADLAERNDALINQYFPTGLWMSNAQGGCEEVAKNDLVDAAVKLSLAEKRKKDKIDVCDEPIELGGKYASPNQTVYELSGGKIFAGAIAAFATGGVALLQTDSNSFKDQNNFIFRDCAKAIRKDSEGNGVEITKRDLTFVAPSKSQCEQIVKAHKSLDEVGFKEQYMRKQDKRGVR